MKTSFSNNWTKISTEAVKIMDARPEGTSLHEFLTDFLMDVRSSSRTAAESILAKLEDGVTLFYNQSIPSETEKLNLDSVLESVSAHLTPEDKRDLLLNMLLIERLRSETNTEADSIDVFCKSMKESLSAEYGVSEDEVERLKGDVLDGIFSIVDQDAELDDAVESITRFQAMETVFQEASLLANNKEEGLVYAVASYSFFCSHPELAEDVVRDGEINPEVVGIGAALALSSAEAIQQFRQGLITKETLLKILKVLYKVFFACLLAFTAYLFLSGIAALSISFVAMWFSLGSFWGILALILAAYCVNASVKWMGEVAPDLWEWGEDAYYRIGSFFSTVFNRIRTWIDSFKGEYADGNHPSPDVQPRLKPDPVLVL